MPEDLAITVRTKYGQAQVHLADGDFASTSAILESASLLLARSGETAAQAQLMKLVGLLHELLEDRVQAGVHYCCALRLSHLAGDDALEQSLLDRLSYLARPGDQIAFVSPGAGEKESLTTARLISQAVIGRLQLLSGKPIDGLRAILAAVCAAPKDGAIRQWWLDELAYLADSLEANPFQRLLAEVNDADVLARLGQQESE